MLAKDSLRYRVASDLIDRFMCVDLTGVGLIHSLYQARQRRQPGPMCMAAAELVAERLSTRGGPLLIATGFPEGGGVPETDGPVAAALLARAMFLGFGALSVIVIDDDWVPMMRATCLGAGLVPRDLPASGIPEPIDFLRSVYIRGVPKDPKGCEAACDALLRDTKPQLMVSIERPGGNRRGVHHALGGRPLTGLVADLDGLFRKARDLGIPFIAFADGGNELGMGVIAEDLASFSPKARDCGCPCGAGIAAVTPADVLVVASVSNWGVTGLIAALTALLKNPALFHDPELEVRAIEFCCLGGGVDGMIEAPESAVDGIAAKEWEGLIRGLRGSVLRTLGITVDWRGRMGDWRQLEDRTNE
jgi:D-glutamate cyclase